MVATVPTLRFAELEDRTSANWPSNGSHGPEPTPAETPGRASARTKARALLRAKARARRREGVQNFGDDFYNMMPSGAATDRPYGASRTMPISIATPRIPSGAATDRPCGVARTMPISIATPRIDGWLTSRTLGMDSGIAASGWLTSRTVGIESGDSEGDSDGNASCAGASKTSDHKDHASSSSSSSAGAIEESAHLVRDASWAWEFPLSAREKQERVLLLYEKEELLANWQVRHSEKLAERLRKQVTTLNDSGTRLRNEQGELRKEVSALRAENQWLHQCVKDLALRLQQQSQPPQQPQSQKPTPRCGTPSQCNGNGIRDTTAHCWTSAMPISGAMVSEQNDTRATTKPVMSTIPMPSPGSCANFRSSGDFVSVPSTAACMPFGTAMTPRSSGLVTARGNASTRGTIVSIAWSEQFGVPWVAFTNRSTGRQTVYGMCAQKGHESSILSLRRGEYICAISGIHSPIPLLAQSLWILTSEQQEAKLGITNETAYSIHAWDFTFEAAPGYEIIGFQLDVDGRLCGVKQAVLGPSRVPSNGVHPNTGCLTARDYTRSNVSTNMGVSTTAGDAGSSWPPQLGSRGMRCGTISRIKEAFEELDA